MLAEEVRIAIQVLLSTNSSEACTSRNHFFLSLDFHEWCCSVMSICLITEVKRQRATLVLGWVTALVQYCSL